MSRIDEIRARLEAVPEPPWQEFCESGDWWIQQVGPEGDPKGAFICSSGTESMSAQVADLVEHAPADIQFLLSEVDRMRQALEYYADPSNYDEHLAPVRRDMQDERLRRDYGTQASIALSSYKEDSHA